MSETNAPEPTMEEILASIRRIISEDEPATSTAAESVTSPGDPPEPPAPHAHGHEPHAHEPHAHAAHAHEGPAREEVLELTERVEVDTEERREPPPPIGDLDFTPAHAAHPKPEHRHEAAHEPKHHAKPEPRHEPKHEAKPAPAAEVEVLAVAMEEPLVGAGAAGLAADHFGALASSVAMPAAGRTLEDVTRELLRPLLKEWLDKHLAAIVEARVQDEVERISRRRTY